MSGDAVSATVGVLLQNLIDFSKDEISLIRGLEEDADNLKGTLTTIQSFLDDAQKQFINEDAVKTWLNELEQLAFDADNVLDELNYQRLSKKVKKEVPSCFPSFNHCLLRRDMAVRIKKLNTTFKSISERATKLGLERRLANALVAAPDSASETDSFTVDPVFIGRDDQVSKIVEVLTTPTEEAVSILPIVGMGGLGKTTLARKVFNHEKTKAHFGQRIWVHVSQDFNAVALLKKILLKVGIVDDESREGLLKKLQEVLGDTTYLLVLDDIWNQDREKWAGFINSWSGITSTKGNVILVTTRNTEVGSIVRTLDVHHLNGLSEEECWSIIKGKTFKGGDIPSAGVEAIGRSIAKRCQGLPLAANVVGGVLRHKSYDEWLSVKENWLSDDVQVDENNISKILKLSFHHLTSPSLKKCFAYCSIFPKGDWIQREKVIEHWMAEGFLQPSQTSNQMENVGNKFFDLLLQNSLLQVLDRDNYDNVSVLYFSMHDLVHDLAGSVLGFPVNDEGTYRARYISWQDESGCIPKEQAKWLRTLLYNGQISEIVFSNFKSLHSLTLASYSIEEFPDSITELIHLRILDIAQTSIRNLPESIGELYHLQTFYTCWYSKKLPSTINYLLNLRHLHMNPNNPIELPPRLGMLTSLQTLPYFKVRNEKGHQIVELGSLKNLKGELKIYDLENVQGGEESKEAYLFQKSGIVKLELIWDGRRTRVEINDENVLKGLQPHPNLKKLNISGFKGARFPSWTLKMAVCLEGHWVHLNNLVDITLVSCDKCEEIPTLGHLPLLKSLYLSDFDNVKSIGFSFYGIDNCSSNDGTIGVFSALESMWLRFMPNLTEWKGIEIPSAAAQVKVFPRLRYLEIRECRLLTNICETKLTSLAELNLEGLHEMACLPDWLPVESLSCLEIKDCPKLKEFPIDQESLKELKIKKCPSLQSIRGRRSKGFSLLRLLSIEDCPELMNFPYEMMLSLETLLFGGRMTKMTKIFECLPKMSRLTFCNIEIVPHAIIASPAATLPNFQILTIICNNAGDSDSWDTVSSLNEVVDGILQLGSHSLRELILELRGKEVWESLPDQLQHLTALEKLTLIGLGIEELPKWFGNLSSVEELWVSDCKKLKHLPSVEAMRRLTNLKKLVIDRCPLLKDRGIEQQSDDGDSEWPKISHIPDVSFDRRSIQKADRIKPRAESS